jgi:hypothetical protein
MMMGNGRDLLNYDEEVFCVSAHLIGYFDSLNAFKRVKKPCV